MTHHAHSVHVCRIDPPAPDAELVVPPITMGGKVSVTLPDVGEYRKAWEAMHAMAACMLGLPAAIARAGAGIRDIAEALEPAADEPTIVEK